MPTDRRNQNRGEEGQNGGSGRESSMASMGRQVREKAEMTGERLQEGYDSARDEVSRRYRQAEGVMARNPGPSVLISFGIGFGLGLVLTTMLSQPEESWSDWADRRRHEGMRRARRSMNQAYGTVQHAQESLHQLPDAFQSLADAVRHLPEAIARRLPSSMTNR